MENEKLNIFDKISLWWRFEARYYHKDFVQGVKNLIKWFPTVWKDRGYDQSYIYIMLSKKLEFQAEYIGNRDFHTRAKRDAEVMRTCVKLIEKIKNDDYGIEYIDYHKTKHRFVETNEMYEGEKTFEWLCDELSENFEDYFKKYPLQYKKVLSGQINRYRREGEKDKKLIAMEIAIDNQERARKLLFKILEEHIERWWD
jgi:hypothetical protein